MAETTVAETLLETVKLEERDCPGGMKLGVITLDAPKSLHALTLDMIRVIDGALVRWAGTNEEGRVAVAPRLLRAVLGWHQWRQARRERRARRAMLAADREWERGLSFGGPGE